MSWVLFLLQNNISVGVTATIILLIPRSDTLCVLPLETIILLLESMTF